MLPVRLNLRHPNSQRERRPNPNRSRPANPVNIHQLINSHSIQVVAEKFNQRVRLLQAAIVSNHRGQ
jgi:hypothetical protein